MWTKRETVPETKKHLETWKALESKLFAKQTFASKASLQETLLHILVKTEVNLAQTGNRL